jgi:hypothetical protein
MGARHLDGVRLAVFEHHYLKHVRQATALALRCGRKRSFDARLDAKGQGIGLKFRHVSLARNVSAWREAFFNALVLRDKAQTPRVSMERKPTREAPRNARAALHTNVDEWQCYISGEARMTVFVSVA